MSVAPIARNERGGIAHTCVRQADKLRDAREFPFRIFEERIVVRDESLDLARRI